MNLHIQIGAAEGETAKQLGLTIKAGNVTHKLDYENGACVVNDVEPGSTITLDDETIRVSAPKKTAAKKRAATRK